MVPLKTEFFEMRNVNLVIAVYNQLHFTQQCVESIARCTSIPHEVIIVDNGSTDGTREFLRTVKATVITNETNLGCAKAWNQGIRASNGEVIGILNNDIVVTTGWLGKLIAFMEKSGHSIVSPAAREGALDYDLEIYAKEFTRRCARTKRNAEVYASCMMIRQEVFDRVGLFDENFSYGGGEDIDFLWRAKLAGFSFGMTGSALIHHFGMVTQDSVKRTETRAYTERNMAYFEKKWKRSIRGNWPQRRWSDLRAAWIRHYEMFRYGHRLVEKR